MECVHGEKDLRRLVWACVLACFWEGLDGLHQALTGADFILGYACNAGRLTGSLGDYTVGNYIALALIPAFALWFVLRRALSPLVSGLLCFALLWPAFFLLIGAASRSGALAVAAAVGLWMLLRGGRGRWKFAVMIKDTAGEAGEVYSISAGLDYPSVGPEHALLKDMGRAEYVSVTDREALDAFFALSRHEGIIPALESSHALAHAMKMAPAMPRDAMLLVNLSGRGDKDVAQVAEMMQKGQI